MKNENEANKKKNTNKQQIKPLRARSRQKEVVGYT